MVAHQFVRQAFSVSRAAEYFDAKELATLTGQPWTRFAAVILKELTDNALDAAEAAGTAPDIEISVSVVDGLLLLSVADNGPGIAPDLVDRVLDFATRTSDKAGYRAPTRGLQGNALKTVLGIPPALGCDRPVTIEARGVLHVIRAGVDAAGEAVIDHRREERPLAAGTIVRAALPADGQDIDPVAWARAFALLNPHAAVRIRVDGDPNERAQSQLREVDDSYRPTVDYPGWRKHGPLDATSPHWYDATALSTLILRHVHAVGRGGPDKPLREFVREFAGLSGTAKAKAVCDVLPGIRTLSDFEGREDAVVDLLAAMQREARPIRPDALGRIGADHLRARIEAWHGLRSADRFWHHRVDGMAGGIPYAVEVAIAQTAAVERPAPTFGVNYSPAFRDPLSGVAMQAGKINGTGIAGLLRDAGLMDMPGGVAAVHVVCPALMFLDRGKSSVDPPAELVDAVQTAVWRAGKTVHADHQRRQRDAAAAQRFERQLQRIERSGRWSLKAAVFEVVEQAWRAASGDGAYTVSARTVYYQVRPLIQPYTDEELVDDYFTQTLLPEYQRTVRPLPGVYYEARGTLHEPHGGQAVPLGTLEVDDYRFPDHVFDKILFIEKQGLYPLLREAGLAQRYDLAIIAGNGYAATAARTLLERARGCQLFVLHDADPHGYNIARTLRAETARMPDYRVDVVDIGLRLEDGLDLGIQPETFTRRNRLPAGIVDGLTDRERAAFVGQPDWSRSHKAQFVCERIELNALTAPQLIAYIEAGLTAHGATAKVIPPTEILSGEARAQLREAMAAAVTDAVLRLADADGIVDRWLADELADGIADISPDRVAAAFAVDRGRSWRQVVAGEMHQVVADADGALDIERRVREALARLN